MIEVIVVISLFVFLSALTAFLSFDQFRSYAWRTEQAKLVSVLQKARAQSMANLCLGAGCTDGQPHGVKILADSYVIFQGASYAVRQPALDEIFESNSLVGHTPTETEIVFVRLSGQANDVSVTLADGVRTAEISVNAEGRISW